MTTTEQSRQERIAELYVHRMMFNNYHGLTFEAHIDVDTGELVIEDRQFASTIERYRGFDARAAWEALSERVEHWNNWMRETRQIQPWLGEITEEGLLGMLAERIEKANGGAVKHRARRRREARIERMNAGALAIARKVISAA
jgi:hypothetical protein